MCNLGHLQLKVSQIKHALKEKKIDTVHKIEDQTEEIISPGIRP